MSNEEGMTKLYYVETVLMTASLQVTKK